MKKIFFITFLFINYFYLNSYGLNNSFIAKGVRFLRNQKRFIIQDYNISATFIKDKIYFNTFVNLKCSAVETTNTYFILGRRYKLKKVFLGDESLSFHKIDLGLPAVAYWVYFPYKITLDEKIALQFVYETSNTEDVFVASIYDFFYPLHYLNNFYNAQLTFTLPLNKQIITNCKLFDKIIENNQQKLTYIGENKVVLSFAVGNFTEKVFNKRNYTIHILSENENIKNIPNQKRVAIQVAKILSYYEKIFTPTDKEIYLLFLNNSNALFAFCAKPLVVFQGDFFKQNQDEQLYLVAHELAHFYWGNTVAPSLDNGFWMVESLAEFSALNFLEKFWNKKNFLNFLKENDIEPYINFLKNNKDIALNKTFPFFTPPEILYNKGALVFRNLSFLMGGNDLINGLKDILEKRKYTFIKTNEFKNYLQTSTQKDLSIFFKYFFENNNSLNLN